MQSCFLHRRERRRVWGGRVAGLTMAPTLEQSAVLSLQVTSEEGARMLKEWPRKEKGEKIKQDTMENRQFCGYVGPETMVVCEGGRCGCIRLDFLRSQKCSNN